LSRRRPVRGPDATRVGPEKTSGTAPVRHIPEPRAPSTGPGRLAWREGFRLESWTGYKPVPQKSTADTAVAHVEDRFLTGAVLFGRSASLRAGLGADGRAGAPAATRGGADMKFVLILDP